MVRLELFRPSVAEHEAMESRADSLVFQTREWMSFLVRTQGGTPVYARVLDGSELIGHFTGLVVRRWGLRILGSPLPGSTTDYLGFNLVEGADRAAAARALPAFAAQSLRCVHVELRDRFLTPEEAATACGRVEPYTLLSIDLSPPEDDLFAGVKKSVRTSVRKARREGVTIEEAVDSGFADDYMAQLTDVFAKQGLVPTYGVDRVRSLIEHLQPTGRLLLLRARDSNGLCIATGIFPGYRDTAYFWGGASWREAQILQPNELIMWHAMVHWKAAGAKALELGGGGAYKAKYRPRSDTVPSLALARFESLHKARDVARSLYRVRQRIGGLVRRPSGAPASTSPGQPAGW